MREITKAQEEILIALWNITEGAIGDILETLPEPRPAYTTVATVTKVLEKKGYVAHKTYGKTNVYFPIISKSEYSGQRMKEAIKGLFNGSVNQLVSAFVKSEKLGLSDLEELKNMLEEEIKIKQKRHE